MTNIQGAQSTSQVDHGTMIETIQGANPLGNKLSEHMIDSLMGTFVTDLPMLSEYFVELFGTSQLAVQQ